MANDQVDELQAQYGLVRQGLTEKQYKFVDAFWKHDGDAHKAAREAGYSENSIRQNVSRLMANEKVIALLRGMDRNRFVAASVTADAIIARLRHIAFFDIDNSSTGPSWSDQVKALNSLRDINGMVETAKINIENNIDVGREDIQIIFSDDGKKYESGEDGQLIEYIEEEELIDYEDYKIYAHDPISIDPDLEFPFETS